MINENNTVTQSNKNAPEEGQLDLFILFGVLWDHIAAIVVVTILGVLAALCVTFFFINPQYRSGFTAYVNNKSESSRAADSLSSGDTSAQQQLTRTYASIITSRPIIEAALQDSGLMYSYEDVKKHITTQIETNTSLINLYVTLDRREDAKKLADSIAKVAPDFVANIVEGSSMKLVSYPIIADKKYSPSYTKAAIIGAIAGFFICAAFVTVRSLLDTKVKNEKELEERFGISVIGTIPNFKGATTDQGGYYYYRRTPKKPEESKTDTKTESKNDDSKSEKEVK